MLRQQVILWSGLTRPGVLLSGQIGRGHDVARRLGGEADRVAPCRFAAYSAASAASINVPTSSPWPGVDGGADGDDARGLDQREEQGPGERPHRGEVDVQGVPDPPPHPLPARHDLGLHETEAEDRRGELPRADAGADPSLREAA